MFYFLFFLFFFFFFFFLFTNVISVLFYGNYRLLPEYINGRSRFITEVVMAQTNGSSGSESLNKSERSVNSSSTVGTGNKSGNVQ